MHLNGLKMGDEVRFAVHMNAKGQNQASFVDRLNNRAVEPRSDTRIQQMSSGFPDKGGYGHGERPLAERRW